MSERCKPKHFIAFTGLIGVGKSTLTDALGAAMGLPVWHEEVEGNPYLALFYADMRAHAFPLQVHLLTQRFAQQQRIVWSTEGGVQDRSIYEDQVFARMLCRAGLMSELNLSTYLALFETMEHFMQRPSLLVYLDVSPADALARIKARGRPMETGITLEYLTQLRDAYEAFIVDISRTVPVLRIDYTRFHSPQAIVDGITKRCAESNVRDAAF